MKNTPREDYKYTNSIITQNIEISAGWLLGKTDAQIDDR